MLQSSQGSEFLSASTIPSDSLIVHADISSAAQHDCSSMKVQVISSIMQQSSVSSMRQQLELATVSSTQLVMHNAGVVAWNTKIDASRKAKTFICVNVQ
jgi:hypothetical protein